MDKNGLNSQDFVFAGTSYYCITFVSFRIRVDLIWIREVPKEVSWAVPGVSLLGSISCKLSDTGAF